MSAIQTLRDRCSALKPRERILVLGGAMLVLLVAIYVFALAPFYKAVDARAERVEQKRTDLAWMRSVAGEVLALGAVAPMAGSPGDESLVVLVDRTARECGLSAALTGQTPSGDNAIRVRFESAAFDALMVCLANLQQRYAVAIESASIDRAAKPGLVNANLVLQRTG